MSCTLDPLLLTSQLLEQAKNQVARIRNQDLSIQVRMAEMEFLRAQLTQHLSLSEKRRLMLQIMQQRLRKEDKKSTTISDTFFKDLTAFVKTSEQSLEHNQIRISSVKDSILKLHFKKVKISQIERLRQISQLKRVNLIAKMHLSQIHGFALQLKCCLSISKDLVYLLERRALEDGERGEKQFVHYIRKARQVSHQSLSNQIK